MVHGLASQLGDSILISCEVSLDTRIEYWLPATVHGSASVNRPEHGSVAVGVAKGTILLLNEEDLVRPNAAYMLAATCFIVMKRPRF